MSATARSTACRHSRKCSHWRSETSELIYWRPLTSGGTMLYEGERQGATFAIVPRSAASGSYGWCVILGAKYRKNGCEAGPDSRMKESAMLFHRAVDSWLSQSIRFLVPSLKNS